MSPLEKVARYKKPASLSVELVADIVEPSSVIVVREVVVLSPIMMMAKSG